MAKVTLVKPEVVTPPPIVTIELSLEEAFFLRCLIPVLPRDYASNIKGEGILFPLWVELEKLDDSEFGYDGPLGTVYKKLSEIQSAIYADYKDRTYLDPERSNG
jgi:hypothetical protein